MPGRKRSRERKMGSNKTVPVKRHREERRQNSTHSKSNLIHRSMEVPSVSCDIDKLDSLLESATQDRILEFLQDHSFSQDELDKALISACRHGHKFLVQTLVRLGANVQYQDTNGNTPLMFCVENGFRSLARYLLSRTADVNAVNSAGDTALILSIHSSGSEDMVEFLLEQEGININHQNQDGYSALMKAVEVKDIYTMKTLLEESYKQNSRGLSDVCVFDKIVNCKEQTVLEIAEQSGLGSIFQMLKDSIVTGMSPLMLAFEKNDTESLAILLHYQFCDTYNMDQYVREAFEEIFKKCHRRKLITISEIAMIKQLLEYGTEVNMQCSDNPIFVAVEAGSYLMVELLCKHVKPSYHFLECGPLQAAARNGRCDIIELLLTYIADIIQKTFVGSALDCALKNGHVDCAKLLIQHGYRLDFEPALHSAITNQVHSSLKFLLERYQNGAVEDTGILQRVLLYAVELGNLNIIGQIIDAGADINQLDNGLTPLVKSKNGQVAQYLIKRGADINQMIESEKNGRITAMMQILITGPSDRSSTAEIVKVFLENGVSVTARCGDGKTALMLAASRYGSMNTLQLLLDYGADLSDQDEEGNTALIQSVLRRHSDNTAFLLLHIKTKDFLNTQNNKGLTALMCAVTSENFSLARMLVNHGANVNLKDISGNTALLLAVTRLSWDDTEILEVLISAGSDVNCQNNAGLSPLMKAACNCVNVAVQVLLESGADVNAVCINDHTALSWLVELLTIGEGNECIIESLLKRGASSSYLEPHHLYKLIFEGLADVIPKLIGCGLGPGDMMPEDLPWESDIRFLISSISPLCMALLEGNVRLARYFMKNVFLTNSDVSSLMHNKNLRCILKKNKLRASVRLFDEIISQPLTLFKLSFVAVSSALGTSPGRENRVNMLPLPQMMKDRLLFKSEEVVHVFSPISTGSLSYHLIGSISYMENLSSRDISSVSESDISSDDHLVQDISSVESDNSSDDSDTE